MIARDVTCCFPGCHRRAIICDIDHCRDWNDGGTTSESNLHALCARHHHLKHDTAWTVRRTRDGTTIWTAPSGHRYTREPERLPTAELTAPANAPPAGDAASDGEHDPPPF